MSDIKPVQVEKPWGNFRQFSFNQPSTVKIITVNANQKLSLQSHKHRSEFWRVIKGSGVVEIDGVRNEVGEGGEYSIPEKGKHRLEGGPFGIKVLEIALGNFDEEDIIRYEDEYGRAKV